jgi:hypothetical protein
MGLKDTGLDVMVWINLIQDSNFCDQENEIWGPKKTSNFLTTFLDCGMKFNEFVPESLPRAPIFFTRIPIQLLNQTLHRKI